jgi:hypothetical protein
LVIMVKWNEMSYTVVFFFSVPLKVFCSDLYIYKLGVFFSV